MPRLDDRDGENCPFLRPETVGRAPALDLRVYCRLPEGHVRVPSRGELARLCTAGHYRDCPAYAHATATERLG
ncbi:MAG: hypothetical protein A2X52_15475 [Candidatus Rokubacteria bacterium GWC2_70_16]|nr:MAG: hypothetical protein A2X52_15475 [Candidatus Rokubacteria bacterium GWC2_70_16]OGL17680.1 MAG: hypothetical protein A3K12_06305 [Candidatus Rokubacteria bacterium RIFCSPLOWO2_12_FULL_71_19]